MNTTLPKRRCNGELVQTAYNHFEINPNDKTKLLNVFSNLFSRLICNLLFVRSRIKTKV